MTDLMSLQLTLDSRQFVAGAQSASQALDVVRQKTISVDQSTVTYGGSMNALFKRGGAVGGISQVAQGIEATTRSLTSANYAVAALHGTFTLLEVGKTAQDFHELAAATSVATRTVPILVREIDSLGVATTRLGTEIVPVATSGFSKFLGVLRGNPLLAFAAGFSAIGAAVTVATSVMSLFGSTAEKTTKRLDDQKVSLADLIVKAREYSVRAALGEPDSRASAGSAVDVVLQLQKLKQDRISLADLSSLLGSSEEQSRYALALGAGLGEDALRQVIRRPAFSLNGRQYPAEFGYEVQDVSRSQAIAAAEYLVQQRRTAEAKRGSEYQRLGLGERSSLFGAYPQDYVSVSDQQFNEVEVTRYLRDVERASAQMDELIGKGREFGSTLGDGAADLLFNLRSARDVVGSIVQDMARAGLRQAGAQIFGAVSGAFASMFNTAPSAPQFRTPGQS